MIRSYYIYFFFLIIPLFSEVIMAFFPGLLSSGFSVGVVTKGMVFTFFSLYKLRKGSYRLYLLGLFYILSIISLLMHPWVFSTLTDLSSLTKVFFPLIIFLFFYENRVPIKHLIEYFIGFNLFISIANWLYIILGYSDLTYGFSFGFAGMFNSTNDLVVCLAFNQFLLVYFYRNRMFRRSILYIIFAINFSLLLIIATRSSIFFGLILTTLLFFPEVDLSLSIKRKKIIRNSILTLTMLLTIFSSMFYIQKFFEDNPYLESKFYALFDSNNTSYESPRKKAFESSVILFNENLYELVFGFGVDNFKKELGKYTGFKNSLTGEIGKHSELDFIDLTGYFGLITSITLIFVYIFIGIRYIKDIQLLFFYIFMLIYSSIAGHVLMNTLLYLPIPLMLMLSNDK